MTEPAKQPITYPYVWYPPAPIPPRGQNRSKPKERRKKSAAYYALLREAKAELQRLKALERERRRDEKRRLKESIEQRRRDANRLRIREQKRELEEEKRFLAEYREVLKTLEPYQPGPCVAPEPGLVHLKAEELQTVLADTDFDAPRGFGEDVEEIEEIIEEELGYIEPARWMFLQGGRFSNRPMDIPTNW
jgi:multidrug efflux pump subunit AcrA (membrane-fusion protein)